MADASRDPRGAPGIDVRRAAVPTPSRHGVERSLLAEGLTPHAWGNVAGVSYDRHTHGYHKVLVCVSGSIVFHTDAGDVDLEPGDRMELAPGVQHGASVGPHGVQCVEAARP
ncbi:MAG TPA: AraC family ligand binding domain-containing protein [Acidimicrobiales bacterium]